MMTRTRKVLLSIGLVALLIGGTVSRYIVVNTSRSAAQSRSATVLLESGRSTNEAGLQ
jgi:hypothetical protein